MMIFRLFFSSFMICMQLVLGIVDVKDLVPIKNIPKTNLFAGIYYTLSMKSFPQGCVTWDYTPIINNPGTPESFDVIDLDPFRVDIDANDKKFEYDCQWTIAAGDRPDQYTLRNRRKSWGPLSYTDITGDRCYRLAVFDGPADDATLSPSGNFSWTFTADKKQTFYKVGNAEKIRSKLTFSETEFRPENYTTESYYIELADFDAGEDALFSFTPWEVRLQSRIYDFKFTSNPSDVFNRKRNQKKELVAKYREVNSNTKMITKPIEDTIQFVNSFTFETKESTSFFDGTEVDLSFPGTTAALDNYTLAGGFEASEPKTVEIDSTKTVNFAFDVPPLTDVETSVYNVWADDVELPFRASLLATGDVEQVVAKQPSQTQYGKATGAFIEAYIKTRSTAEDSKKTRLVRRYSKRALYELNGKVTVRILLKTILTTKIVKRIVPGQLE